jgi:hypothetical protein
MDEEIKAQKKQWHQPELIVLVRGRPEEAVLTGCRAGPGTGGSCIGGTSSNNCQGPGCGYNGCAASCSGNQKS